ncbi:MAG: energy-coupling factor transporter transmembrane component T [Candidatus Neomarinimicrobiota bacterium]
MAILLKQIYGNHALVVLWFFLNFSFSILAVRTAPGLVLYALCFLFLILLNIQTGWAVLNRIKPVIYFFPILILFYAGFSLLFTNGGLDIIFREIGFGFTRLILIMGIMALYFENTARQDLLLVFRSIWIRFNLTWKWIEDAFIFLEMTMRFYPEFQKNWNSIRQARSGLGFRTKKGFKNRIIAAVEQLPGLLLVNLRRAEDIAAVMQLRGYGLKFPRGVTFPVPFTGLDISKMAGLTLIFWGINYFAAL